MGLTGMPGIWLRLMRVFFGKFEFVVVYLDAIYIFSLSYDEHSEHLDTGFAVLRIETLYAHIRK